MRHTEWKKLLGDPVVLKAREALKCAQEELRGEPFWEQKVAHLNIFPDPGGRKVLQLLVTDLAFLTLGQSLPLKREIAWNLIATASPQEAQAIVLIEILQFHPSQSLLKKGVGEL